MFHLQPKVCLTDGRAAGATARRAEQPPEALRAITPKCEQAATRHPQRVHSPNSSHLRNQHSQITLPAVEGETGEAVLARRATGPLFLGWLGQSRGSQQLVSLGLVPLVRRTDLRDLCVTHGRLGPITYPPCLREGTRDTRARQPLPGMHTTTRDCPESLGIRTALSPDSVKCSVK